MNWIANRYCLLSKDTVSVGAYAVVLSVLELDKDIELIAVDEDGKKKFRENTMFRRERATRKEHL